VVKTSPSNEGGTGSLSSLLEELRSHVPPGQNNNNNNKKKQKQYCDKDFKNGPCQNILNEKN